MVCWLGGCESASRDEMEKTISMIRMDNNNNTYSHKMINAEIYNRYDDAEYVDVFKTDYWKNVTPRDLLAGTRLKHELTQEQLAEKSGIHQVVISAYETGRRKLSRRAAIKLAQAMDEDPDSFFRNVEQQ